jgi:quinohemoprotein ethanol dehydrogenase
MPLAFPTRLLLLCAAASIALPALSARNGNSDRDAEAQLIDKVNGDDWPAFGRTYGEQHFSPLDGINDDNVGKLGLVWSMDLEPGNSATGPIEVGGVLYFARFYSVVTAVEAATGKLLWTYDPRAPEASGARLRQGWGSRGIAWWDGKVYTATQDGRLIAIDGKTGKPVWSVQTLDKGDPRFISGPPRAFDGKIIIGNAGADEAAIRGYVTAYDATTGKQLWRFWTVPGDPKEGFENPAMAMAAKTWAGDWWTKGGGGTVWNAITYDRDSDTIYLGTGNGSPWNRKLRSDGKGDNLFLCSILALDAKTGVYKWHYQINPGESWDFNAAMDMELADLTIEGRQRKVLMTAPKNGFLYVIDRLTGKLISAKPFVPVTWAKGIDIASGRPIENPGIRYESGTATFSPTPVGAHSWLPMAFSPQSGFVYIPAIELEATYDDRGITPQNWKRKGGLALDYGVNSSIAFPKGREDSASSLVAWDPVRQKEVWRVPTPIHFNGGVMATAGNLVFQGQMDSQFNAYDAQTGQRLWSFDARAPVIAPPISYRVNGRQYVTVLTGNGTSGGFLGAALKRYGIDYRSQARRVLTFALGGTMTLPPKQPYVAEAVDDPAFKADAAAETRGGATYNTRCVVCHGGGVAAAGVAPDLRTSGVIVSPEVFDSIIHDGASVPQGMPRFEELTPADREDLRQFLRAAAHELRRTANAKGKASP